MRAAPQSSRVIVMPKEKWSGYHRFCPLARGLDLLGERWTMPILQELMSRPLRYNELLRRLPGVSPNVLADRLKKLEGWQLVERAVGGAGSPVMYRLTDSGRALEPVFASLRRWGVEYLLGDGAGDAAEDCSFDVSFVDNVEAIPREQYEWHIGPRVLHLEIVDGMLHRRGGPATAPAVVVSTTDAFMRRWAAGEIGWEAGRAEGVVQVEGSDEAWQRMLAATGYLRGYQPS